LASDRVTPLPTPAGLLGALFAVVADPAGAPDGADPRWALNQAGLPTRGELAWACGTPAMTSKPKTAVTRMALAGRAQDTGGIRVEVSNVAMR
jgi:hypothetical protein